MRDPPLIPALPEQIPSSAWDEFCTAGESGQELNAAQGQPPRTASFVCS